MFMDRRPCPQLVERYLHMYGKQLDARCLAMVLGAPQCSNPLFLRLLLDELRVVGQFEGLEQQIRGLLTATVRTILTAHATQT